MIVVGIAVAGASGAVLRHLVDHLVQRRIDREFPLGILAVNVSGSFALGTLVGAGLHHVLSATSVTVLGTGLIGSFTTFSTFTFDTVRLVEDGFPSTAVLNALVAVGVGIGAAVAGIALGSLL
jgi:fluoride exporter